MENLKLQQNWLIQAMFHKNSLARVKRETGAHHVIHIEDFRNTAGEKINCILMKGKEGELKYGGAKPFYLWEPQDYTNAIKMYKDEFDAS